VAAFFALTFGSGVPMPRGTKPEIYHGSRIAALGRLEPQVRRFHSLLTCFIEPGPFSPLFSPSGPVQLQDKIVARFALTIYPYSLGVSQVFD
jgi:hypothetical protein